MFIQVNNLIKKLKIPLIISLLLAMVFVFRYSILSLIQSEDVKGWKYIGLDVDGGTTNGYTYFAFNNYFTAIQSGNKKDWSHCNKLNNTLNGQLSFLVSGWNSNSNYWYISESNSYSYKAYIKTDGKLVYVNGFADFGGAYPSDEEKQVCLRKKE